MKTRIKKASEHNLGGDRKTGDSTSEIHVVILTSPVVVKSARIIYMALSILSQSFFTFAPF